MATEHEINELINKEQVVYITPAPEPDQSSGYNDARDHGPGYNAAERMLMQDTLTGYAHDLAARPWDKEAVKSFGNLISPAMDSVTAARLINDLGLGGSSKVYFKTILGRRYAIFQGSSSKRKIFTATKYGIYNAKIVRMAIGRQGLGKLVEKSGLITFVIFAGIEVFHMIASDTLTMGRVLGTLGMDVAKIFLSCSIGYFMGVVAGMVFSVAAAPIIAVIVFGTAAAFGLEALDKHYSLTEKLIYELEKIERKSIKKYGIISKTVFSNIAKYIKELEYRALHGKIY